MRRLDPGAPKTESLKLPARQDERSRSLPVKLCQGLSCKSSLAEGGWPPPGRRAESTLGIGVAVKPFGPHNKRLSSCLVVVEKLVAQLPDFWLRPFDRP